MDVIKGEGCLPGQAKSLRSLIGERMDYSRVREENTMAKKKWLLGVSLILFSIAFLFGCVADVRVASPPVRPLPPPPSPPPPPPPPPRILPGELRALDLDMSPDPVHEGQNVRFRMKIANASPHSGRVNLFIRDRDEIVAAANNILLRPGQNQIEFPHMGYRFRHQEHCFLVEVDIERTRSPIDVARKFCARRTQVGWTLAEVRIGPFFVKNLDMHPVPVFPREEVRFKVNLDNGGSPVRANLWIQDRNEVVTRLEGVTIRPGPGEYQFPPMRYAFQRNDHCFVVFLDVERTSYKVDAQRGFCAKPLGKGRGWTLNP
jgi:hypothetical protein